MLETLSRAKAVKAFCRQCMGDEKMEVRFCTAKDCPLYAWKLGRTVRETDYYPEPGDEHMRIDEVRKVFEERLSKGWKNPFCK